MQFIKFDGTPTETNQNSEINFNKKVLSNGLVEFQLQNIERNLVLPELLEIVSEAVGSKPEFIGDDALWLASHLLDFKEYCLKWKRSHLSSLEYDDSVNSYLLGRGALFRTRFYYMLEVIDSLLYGAELGVFEITKKKPTFKIRGMIKPALADENFECFRKGLTEVISKSSYKSWESLKFYNRTPVVFKAENIETEGDNFNKIINNMLCVGNIQGFYKSSSSSSAIKNLCYSKALGDSTSLKPSFYPFLQIQLEFIDGDNGIKLYRVHVPFNQIIGVKNLYTTTGTDHTVPEFDFNLNSAPACSSDEFYAMFSKLYENEKESSKYMRMILSNRYMTHNEMSQW